ncbi:MAG: formylglycine-generating enzyme family protein [Bacteroidales bacterium]|nr:formylglycine-generating enzyme family protein [Bacteroidales bacterium]
MNRLATFSLCMVAALVALPMFSQGIVVCKKDGTRMVFPYETIDSVVTYNYDEEPPTGGGGTSGSVGEDKVIIANGVSFTMKPVAGGTFTMGATSEQHDPDDDERPTHSVTLSDYYIGETEVTQELWTAVMGDNPSHFTENMQRPVEQVSWNDCQTFIQKLNELTGANFRLPTEAEWEFAARGGRNSRGYQYSGSSNLDDVAWYDGNSSSTTHPVKTKSPNELGIYDMSGNVWEWCQDWYGNYSSSSQTNPTGPSTGSNRVCRGGCWANLARYCRSAYRFKSGTPGRRDYILGLRLAL